MDDPREDRKFLKAAIAGLERTKRRSGFLNPADEDRLEMFRKRYAQASGKRPARYKRRRVEAANRQKQRAAA